jgi:hypothetical protein
VSACLRVVRDPRLKLEPEVRTSVYPYVALRGPTYRENSHANHTWHPQSHQTACSKASEAPPEWVRFPSPAPLFVVWCVPASSLEAAQVTVQFGGGYIRPSSGLALSSIRSARLPIFIVPNSFLRPRNLAGSRVAARKVSLKCAVAPNRLVSSSGCAFREGSTCPDRC